MPRSDDSDHIVEEALNSLYIQIKTHQSARSTDYEMRRYLFASGVVSDILLVIALSSLGEK
jgi:hypothetical protein